MVIVLTAGNFGEIMENFLVDIEYDPLSGSYMACYSNGSNILLGATTYHDAVLEADMLEPENYELGYN
jgi:hypothetical protein